MFIANDHNNYAQYVPVQLITLINLSDTHRRCKELLEQNGFIVSQQLVLCLRNAFDITIRQTIKRYYRLQQLELRFVLQMEWCFTHHIRAQYIELTLQCTEKKYSICSDAKYNEYKRQFQASPILLVLVLKTINSTFCLSVFLQSLAWLSILLRLMTLNWPCSAAHNFDVNAITTEHNSFSCHLQGSSGTSGRVLDSGPKGYGFEPHPCHCVVVLEQDTFILA